VQRDDDVRTSCFSRLDVLCAIHGQDVPYRGGLDEGFAFRGQRVPFLSPQKGIFRAAAQRGPAALSINTSANSPYDDEEIADGFRYTYRAGPIDQPDNKALRAACSLGTPVVYFRATGPGWYRPLYPAFIIRDEPASRSVVLSPGRMVGPLDERDPAPFGDVLERRYAVREERVRLHQAAFRRRVIFAYASSCTICRLKELRLLDAAHIVGDAQETGEPRITNGLSLCSIHHRAFDQNLVGIDPDHRVHVSHHLLEDEDGPMLELLKTFHHTRIVLPQRRAWQPDREQLAARFGLFPG